MTRASDTAEWLNEYAGTVERGHANPFNVEFLRNAADLIEELAKDGERLDWFWSNCGGTYCEDDNGWTVIGFLEVGPDDWPDDPRAAIDAAMKGEE